MNPYSKAICARVDVQLDNETSTDHLKLIVVDDKSIYVRSFRWSDSALYFNHETSAKMVSEAIAESYTEYLEATFGIKFLEQVGLQTYRRKHPKLQIVY